MRGDGSLVAAGVTKFRFADFGPPFGYCVSEVTGALTANWVETLSASGHASIVCRFKS